MVYSYYCIDCDFFFSVVTTGIEPNARCPRCHAGCPKRVFQKYKNTPSGMILKEKEM